MMNSKLEADLVLYERLKSGEKLNDIIDETREKFGLRYLEPCDLYFKDLPVENNNFYLDFLFLRYIKTVEIMGEFGIYRNSAFFCDCMFFGRDMNKMPMMFDGFDYKLCLLNNGEIEMVWFRRDLFGSKMPLHYTGKVIINEELKPVLRRLGMTEEELKKYTFLLFKHRITIKGE